MSSAGNVNDRLNRELESCAWLEVWLALLRGTFPWNMYSCVVVRRLVFHADLVEHYFDVRHRLTPCLGLTSLVNMW